MNNCPGLYVLLVMVVIKNIVWEFDDFGMLYEFIKSDWNAVNVFCCFFLLACMKFFIHFLSDLKTLVLCLVSGAMYVL